MSAPASPFRVALIDDHPGMRAGLRSFIDDWSEFRVVVEAANGEEYEQLAREAGHVHLAVVDLLMPRRNGIETMRWMARHQPRTRPIGYSFELQPMQMHQLLAAGARGMLLKDQPMREFRQVLTDVATTGFHYNTHISRAHRAGFLAEQRKLRPQERWDKLSPREREFLLLYTSHGMEHLADVAQRMGVARSTAKTWLDAVITKTGIHNRGDLVRWVLENGWG